MNTVSNRQIIGNVLSKKAATDRNLIVLCSDSRGSASVTDFANAYPEQFVEVGIAEQNLVSIAAGMASCGKKPFVFSPASFLSTRSYEQIKVDVAYSRTNVKLVGISGGLSYGALGMTHFSLQDIAAISALPDMRVYLPCDRFQTEKLIAALLEDNLPAYIRVSRNPSADVYGEDYGFCLNKADIHGAGGEVLIAACGETVAPALQAAALLKNEGVSATVADVHCLKPFDKQTIINAAECARLIVTVEEHSVFGGLGAMTAQCVGAALQKTVLNIAVPDTHLIAGTSGELFKHYGLDSASIAAFVTEKLK